MSGANRPLSGETAVVSGGLGDIGAAVVRALTDAGAAVAVCDVVPSREGASRAAGLVRGGEVVRYDQVDVRDADAVEAWIADVTSAIGPPTLAVPAAATVTSARATDITPQQWSDELRTDVDGAFFVVRAVIDRLLAARRTGHIVFIGSWAAHRPHPHVPAYSTAKAALRMLCQCLALEYAAAGILVNEVAPGLVNAGLSKKAFEADEQLRRRSHRAVPLGRMLSPDDVAREVVHLCTTTTMTGSTVIVDGGLSLPTPLTAGAGDD